mmetsp:Transcript_13316/g.14424  ORF Transcript_13316/g.14424 Transcript_13316/m.14424 type:complete len:379 (+) Transcript_13316:93-1229(+)
MNAKELRSLFIGDLSVHCTEKDIYAVFQSCGPIESVKVKQAFSHQSHSAYGFVTYMTVESAQRAMDTLQGALLLGRPLKVNWAQRNVGKRLRPKDPTESLRTAQIHISYISRQTDAVISESSLRSLFSQFGEVVDVTIKKSQFDPRLCLQNGYGFVHYPMSWEGVLSALKAIQVIHQVTIGPVTYDSTLSSSLRAIIESDPYLWEIWQGFREATPPEAPGFSTRLPQPLEHNNDGNPVVPSISMAPRSAVYEELPSYQEHSQKQYSVVTPPPPRQETQAFSTYFQPTKVPNTPSYSVQPPLQPLSYSRELSLGTYPPFEIDDSRFSTSASASASISNMPMMPNMPPISSSSSSPPMSSSPMDMMMMKSEYPMFPPQQR